jgi:hypothetical protein
MYFHVNMPIDPNEEGIAMIFLNTFIWCVLLSGVGVETEVYLLHGLDILVHDPYLCSPPSLYIVVQMYIQKLPMYIVAYPCSHPSLYSSDVYVAQHAMQNMPSDLSLS